MKQVHSTLHANIATVKFHSVLPYNALNVELVQDLGETFLQLGLKKDLKAIVLSSDGPTFCAGIGLHWLNQMCTKTWDENREDAQALASTLWAIRHCATPVIVRVQGSAYAGGAALIAACDYRLASANSEFWFSEGKLGPISLATMPYVGALVGDSTATVLSGTAERIDANTAKRIGLLNEVVPPNQLDHAIQRLISREANLKKRP